MLSKAQLLSLLIAPMVTGTLSFITSLTIIVMIIRSKLKLSTIYRRLMFSVSFFDVLLSLSQAASTLPMPAGTTWASVGGDTTCVLQGLFTVVGLNGVLLYSVSLSIYFLFVVRFNMTERNIKERNIEPILHAVPITYAFAVGTYLLITNNYHPAGPICWIGPDPDCVKDPDAECSSKLHQQVAQWVGGGGTILGTFFINCIIMAVIWWTVYVTSASASTSTSPRKGKGVFGVRGNQRKDNSPADRSSLTGSPKSHGDIDPNGPLAARLSKRSRASILRQKEISNRAIAYILGSLLCFFSSGLYRLLEAYSKNGAPFFVVFISRLMFPLQGFFNILIFTYPHVISHHRDYNCSYIKSFIAVLKSGGDSDEIRAGRTRNRRRESIRTKLKLNNFTEDDIEL